MRLNVNKSVCMRFGSKFDTFCANIVSLDGSALQWVSECRYLGVYFTSGRCFRCCYSRAKSSFFSAFNAIFGKVGRFASQEVVLNLIRAKCLPCLLYGLEACPLFKRDKQSFDFTLTRVFMKLFSTGSPVTVNQCQVYFNFLPLRYQIDIRTVKFLTRYINSPNAICCNFAGRAHSDLTILLSSYGDSVDSLYDMRAVIDSQFFV